MDFLGKTYKIRSKTEKVNTTIKFYTYEISPKKPKKKKKIIIEFYIFELV